MFRRLVWLVGAVVILVFQIISWGIGYTSGYADAMDEPCEVEEDEPIMRSVRVP